MNYQVIMNLLFIKIILLIDIYKLSNFFIICNCTFPFIILLLYIGQNINNNALSQIQINRY
jgi:hypothetical protein